MFNLRNLSLLSLFAFLAPLGQAADLTSDQVDVIGITPLESTGTPINQIPSNVQILKSDQIKQQKPSNMADLLNDNLGNVSVSNGVGNPYQNDVNYRGFQATSLLGAPVGLSVYFDGVRFNEPFGSTVNWDLIPMNAVSGINLMPGSNPLFGLNTLGGALAINTKNGKDFPGGSVTLLGGSFGRRALNAEYGGVDDVHNLDYFVSINKDYQDGWRDHSKSDVQQLFGKLRWHSADNKNNLEVSVAFADNELNGTQALPLSMLSNPKQAYTWPDTIKNRMALINLKASSWLSDTRYVAANAYYRKQDSNTFNSNVGLDDGCTPTKCLNSAPDGTAPNSLATNPLAVSNGLQRYTADINSTNVSSNVKQDTFGTSLQYSIYDKLFGHNNALTSGFVGDHSNIKYVQNTQLARLINYQTVSTPNLRYVMASGVSQNDGLINNVNLNAKTKNFSLFLSDNFEINDKLNATIAGSFNTSFLKQKGQNSQYLNTDGGAYWDDYYNPAFDGAITYSGTTSATKYQIDGSGNFQSASSTNNGASWSAWTTRATQEGPETNSLNGYHHYSRFNPSLGLNYNSSKALSFFGGYSESMRAPTPIEVSCADKNNPCNLPTGFNGDPDLKEVVAKTMEAGVRGKLKFFDNNLNWNTAVYNSYNFNDIQFISASATSGYFQNVGKTRRTGLELNLNTKLDKLFLAASYGYVDATFRSNFDVTSAANSSAVNSVIHVSKGNTIPGIADQALKLRAAYDMTPSWNLGSNIVFASSQYAHGDENNQDSRGKIPGYGIMNLDTNYKINDSWTAFGLVNNLFDKDYSTFGMVGTNVYNNKSDQFRTPATERSAWVGLTFNFGGKKSSSIDRD